MPSPQQRWQGHGPSRPGTTSSRPRCHARPDRAHPEPAGLGRMSRTRSCRDDRDRTGLRAGHPPDLPCLRRASTRWAPRTRAWSASDRSRSATRSWRRPARRSPPGPRASGATGRCCRSPGTSPSSPACTPGSRSWSAPTTWPASWACAGCGSRTTPATRRTRSRTASWPWPSRPPASWACRRCRAPRPATSPTPSPPRPPAPGMGHVVVIPANLEAGKIITTAVYGGTLIAVDGNYDDVNRLCSELVGDPLTAHVGLRQRQPPAVLRRGIEVAGLRGGRAARLAAARAGGHPGRLRLAAHQGRQGLRRARSARPGRAEPVPGVRRPGHGLLARSRRPTAPAST